MPPGDALRVTRREVVTAGSQRRERTAPRRPARPTAPRRRSGTDTRPREHVVVVRLDLVEDLAVERERGAQAVARGGVDEVDARLGRAVVPAGALDLPGQQVADRLVDPARGPAGRGRRRTGRASPAAGTPGRAAGPRPRRAGSWSAGTRSPSSIACGSSSSQRTSRTPGRGSAATAGRSRRPSPTCTAAGPRRSRSDVDGEVRAHRRQEVGEVRGRQRPPSRGVQHGAGDRVAGRAPVELREEARGPRGERGASRRARRARRRGRRRSRAKPYSAWTYGRFAAGSSSVARWNVRPCRALRSRQRA